MRIEIYTSIHYVIKELTARANNLIVVLSVCSRIFQRDFLSLSCLLKRTTRKETRTCRSSCKLSIKDIRLGRVKTPVLLNRISRLRIYESRKENVCANFTVSLGIYRRANGMPETSPPMPFLEFAEKV